MGTPDPEDTSQLLSGSYLAKVLTLHWQVWHLYQPLDPVFRGLNGAFQPELSIATSEGSRKNLSEGSGGHLEPEWLKGIREYKSLC